MLNIGNKTFMNLQEAVGWLLENNALPFQSTANYVGNTEIAMSTLINPSPAKVRVGSLIFFADSKVSTVVGVTSNSFIVSDQYNDLVDDVVYVSGVALNASGHLIVTLSNGNTIDAGLVKQVTGFSIDGSQHLIVTYNDGSTTDLGAIFSGNITISGNLTVSGTIDGVTLLEKIVDSQGHNRFLAGDLTVTTVVGFTFTYAKWSLSGTHLLIVLAGTCTDNATIADNLIIANVDVPQWILNRIYTVAGNTIENKKVPFTRLDQTYTSVDKTLTLSKPDSSHLDIRNISGTQTVTNASGFRIEFDLLIENN